MDKQSVIAPYLRAGYSCLWVRTHEYVRAEKRLREELKEDTALAHLPVYIWKSTQGLYAPGKQADPLVVAWDPYTSLAYILDDMTPSAKEAVFFFHNIKPYLDQPNVIQAILDLGAELRTVGGALVFIGPTPSVLPTELLDTVHVVDFPLPTREELAAIVEQLVKSTEGVPEHSEYEISQAADCSTGLTALMAESTYALSLVKRGRIDTALIQQEKKAAIQQASAALSFVETDASMSDVGGMDRLKEYMYTRRAFFSQAARHYGLRPPKGVMLVGIAGTGKSLSAKAAAAAIGLPLYRFDLSAVFQRYVGQSEEEVRRALKIAETAAPCVTGDTEVWLADGRLVSIEDLFIAAQNNMITGLEVVAYHEKQRKLVPTTVQAITRREAPVFEVKAELGYAIKSTGNHPHLVMRGGEPEWVRTDEIKPGDMLAVAARGLDGSSSAERFWPEGLRRVDGQWRLGRGGFMDSVVPKLPERITPQLAWLAASVMEGDGFVQSNGIIGFTNTNRELLDAFRSIMEQEFGLSPMERLHTRPGTVCMIGNKQATSRKEFFIAKVGSKIAAQFLENLWNHVLSLPVEARAAAVAGIIDSDGTVEPTRITLTFSSEAHPHRRGLYRALLQSIGVIPGAVSTNGITVSGLEAVKLAKVVLPFLRHPDKRSGCERPSQREAVFSRGMGFLCGNLLQEARKKSGLSHAQLGMPFAQTWEAENNRRPLSERVLQKYVDRLGEAAGDLQRLLDADCLWVRVKSVEPIGEDVVYDLVCDGEYTRSFVANGIITHNCVLIFDEFEKAVAGLESSGRSDSGVTSRVVGTLLTWMQECTAPIMKIATCNTIRNLDPAIFRRGRWDAIFGIDLPNARERREIFEIHLRKRGRDPANYDIGLLVKLTEGFVGAEIESVIDDAMYQAFSDNEREFETADLVAAAKELVPLSTTCKEEIEAFRALIGTRFTPASYAEESEESGKVVEAPTASRKVRKLRT